MIYNFQILELIIIALLIANYYTQEIKKTETQKVFNNFMIFTYLTQAIYVASYILTKQNFIFPLINKLYLIFLMITFSILTIYHLIIGKNYKYLGNINTFNNHKKTIHKIFFITNIILSCLFFILPLSVNNLAPTRTILSILITSYTIINFLIIMIYNTYLPKSKKRVLFLINLITLLFILINTFTKAFLSFNDSLILSLLLMYITIENSKEKEIEKLQLERDYARLNNLDKSKFLKKLSYELRTPLNTIDGFSQVIMESDNIDVIKEDIKDIRASSKNLIDTINTIIDMNLIESGNLEIANDNYNIYDMFHNINEIISSKIKNTKITYHANIPTNIPKELIGDAERIEQVLLNIINNIIKKNPSTTISLETEAIKSTTICRIKIKITATQTKYSSEEIKNIFAPTSTNQYKNENLEIAFTNQLLSLMNAKFEILNSNEEVNFMITLDQKISLDIDQEKNKSQKLTPFQAPTKRILLVDDNKLNIKVAKKLLEPYEIKIEEATSGQECLDILDKDNHFDLILMDDLMPEMSGTETLKILKKVERVEGYEIPVVVLTANAISGMKNKYLTQGFDDYLSKPIDKYELNRVLNRFLNHP